MPADLAAEVTAALDIPTIGIGAGPDTDGQVLVWHDMLGLTTGRLPRFVKQYADLRSQITDAVKAFATEVADGDYPAEEHTYGLMRRLARLAAPGRGAEWRWRASRRRLASADGVRGPHHVSAVPSTSRTRADRRRSRPGARR